MNHPVGSLKAEGFGAETPDNSRPLFAFYNGLLFRYFLMFGPVGQTFLCFNWKQFIIFNWETSSDLPAVKNVMGLPVSSSFLHLLLRDPRSLKGQMGKIIPPATLQAGTTWRSLWTHCLITMLSGGCAALSTVNQSRCCSSSYSTLVFISFASDLVAAVSHVVTGETFLFKLPS